MERILPIFEAIGGFMRTYGPFFVGYALLVNLIAFAMYGLDKRAAGKKQWRIPERSLICMALLGGSVGAFAAMYFFRHKTKHRKFTVTVPLVMILQIALIAVCLYVSK